MVGVSALFPGSTDVRGFWQDIMAGTDLITDIPPNYWLIEDYHDPDPTIPDKTYGRRGAFLDKIDFDPIEYGLPPATLSSTDTCQILALMVAKRVLNDATRGQFAQMDPSNVSVILGAAAGMELLGEMASRLQKPVWLKALREEGVPEEEAQAICQRISDQYVPWTEATFPGLLGNVITGRIANRFNLGGTNCTTDAACASSFSALTMAVNELHLGDSDMVITGGVDTTNDPFLYMCFSKTPALSFTGDCRPFDHKADGTMLGEGLGMVALRRLEDAERDGDDIYAVLRGVGTSSDGRAKSVYAPLPEGQARALRRAYGQAGFGPETVELVEAHGTGTMAGDIAEFRGLCLAFGETSRQDRQWCALGSVKSQIGHTKGAAGVAGLIKVIMAVHHKALPPTIKVERPDPAMEVEKSPFYLNTAARPWIRDGRHPRRGSVSSFGFGGTNFHVAVEEYSGPSPSPGRLRTWPVELALLGADDGADLAARCRVLAGAVTDEDGLLRFLARTTQEEFDAGAGARVALLASDAGDLRRKLEQAADKIEAAPDRAFSLPTGIHYGLGAPEGDVAFIFPGQGSQYLDMGQHLALALDCTREVWDRAADIPLDEELSLDRVVFPPACFEHEADRREALAQRLTATEWAQPALGAASLGTLALLRQMGLEPSCVGGHSFGEITALHAAGVLEEAETLRVARKRGELMAAAASVPGTMTAVMGAAADEVLALLDGWGCDVTVANHNSPRQLALSGTVEAIEDVEHRLGKEGITARRLPVATAFHSPVVSDSAGPFLDFLEGVAFCAPTLPVYANSEAAPYPGEAAPMRTLLGNQITRPVLFAQQVEAMYEAGARTFVEVGPGSVLTGLVGQCLGRRSHLAVSTDRKGQHGLKALQAALGRLAASGVPLNFAPLWSGYRLDEDPRLRKKPKMVVPIDGSNHGKRYPPEGGAGALPKPNPPRPTQEREDTVTMSERDSNKEQSKPTPAAAASNDAPAPVAQPTAAAATSAETAAWIRAYEDLQRQTASAHAAFQKTMAESHMAFLRTAETSVLGLQSLLTGQPVAQRTLPATLPPDPIQRPPTMEIPLQDVWTPQPAEAPVPPPTVAPPPPLPAEAPPRPALTRVPTEQEHGLEQAAGRLTETAEITVDELPVVSVTDDAVSAPPAMAETTAASPVPDVDYKELLLSVVAEKTGYPVDILEMDMGLEADLGIDSIKRVEILSALQEKAPWLPEVDASVVPKLQTLGQVLNMLEEYRTGRADGEADSDSTPEGDSEPDPEADPATPESDEAEELIQPQPEPEPVPEPDPEPEPEPEVEEPEVEPEVQEPEPEPEPTPDEAVVQELDAVEIPSSEDTVTSEEPAANDGPMMVHELVDETADAEEAGEDEGEEEEEEDLPEIGRYTVQEVEAEATGHSMLGDLSGGPLVITDDGEGVARVLVGKLRQRGLNVQLAQQVPKNAGGVIYLGGLREIEDERAAMAVNREAFVAAQTVGHKLSTAGGLLVMVQDTGGDFGLSGNAGQRAWLGGLAALARTAAREWDRAQVKAIDLERDGRSLAQVADALLEELTDGGTEVEVGLHADGARVTLENRPSTLTPGEPVLNKDSVLVVTGGGKGVTADTLVELAQRFSPRILILGRTELMEEAPAYRDATNDAELKQILVDEAREARRSINPKQLREQSSQILANRQVRATLAALRDAGSEVNYLSLDVRDAEAVEAALELVRQEWGPITGIIHGAGVISDKLIVDKKMEQFELVFDTKVEALRTLLAATRTDPLNLLCLFSSVAARQGNIGQCDYAMANEVLNQVAGAEAALRGKTCMVRSINWGPWDGGMVTPALAGRFREMGVPLIPLKVGARMLVEELQGDISGPVDLLIGGIPPV